MGTVHGLMVHWSIRVVTTFLAGGKETFSETGQVRDDDIDKVGDRIDGHMVEVDGGACDCIGEILVSTGTGTIKEHISLGLADGPIVARCTDRELGISGNRVGRGGVRFGRSGLAWVGVGDVRMSRGGSVEGREVEPEGQVEDQVGEVRLQVVDGDAPSLLERASQRQDERKEEGEYHHQYHYQKESR